MLKTIKNKMTSYKKVNDKEMFFLNLDSFFTF